MKTKEEEHFDDFIDQKFPKHLKAQYAELIGAIKAGFYEGIKFEKNRKKSVTSTDSITYFKKK